MRRTFIAGATAALLVGCIMAPASAEEAADPADVMAPAAEAEAPAEPAAPAEVAEVAPFGESSMARQSVILTPRRSAARR